MLACLVEASVFASRSPATHLDRTATPASIPNSLRLLGNVGNGLTTRLGSGESPQWAKVTLVGGSECIDVRGPQGGSLREACTAP
jgi:hypothetical protein